MYISLTLSPAGPWTPGNPLSPFGPCAKQSVKVKFKLKITSYLYVWLCFDVPTGRHICVDVLISVMSFTLYCFKLETVECINRNIRMLRSANIQQSSREVYYEGCFSSWYSQQIPEHQKTLRSWRQRLCRWVEAEEDTDAESVSFSTEQWTAPSCVSLWSGATHILEVDEGSWRSRWSCRARHTESIPSHLTLKYTVDI